jgi:hypothetical protein
MNERRGEVATGGRISLLTIFIFHCDHLHFVAVSDWFLISLCLPLLGKSPSTHISSFHSRITQHAMKQTTIFNKSGISSTNTDTTKKKTLSLFRPRMNDSLTEPKRNINTAVVPYHHFKNKRREE